MAAALKKPFVVAIVLGSNRYPASGSTFATRKEANANMEWHQKHRRGLVYTVMKRKVA